MGKKILIIGNGFDLTHGLPTRYSDFLNFIELIQKLNKPGYGKRAFDDWAGNVQILEMLKDSRKTGNAVLQLKEYLQDNIWVVYLSAIYEDKIMQGENWIDFESEISHVIQWMDQKEQDISLSTDKLTNKVTDYESDDPKIYKFMGYIQDHEKEYTTIDLFIQKLYIDLERMIQALQIYLVHFVERIPIEHNQILEGIKPNYVISFNYTHIFERTYGNAPVCYIHGECKDTTSCNMVLGIDEYLPEGERNERTNYAIFKKFLQRIRKKNDLQYLKWSREIEGLYRRCENMRARDLNPGYIDSGISDLYVYGHSLDITDKDVLKHFLEPKYTRLHIYAKDVVTEGKLLSNMIQIMSEKTLIKKSTTEMLETKVI